MELLILICGYHIPLTLNYVTFIYDETQSKLFTDQPLTQLKKWRQFPKTSFSISQELQNVK
jgi:hypothetical protein